MTDSDIVRDVLTGRLGRHEHVVSALDALARLEARAEQAERGAVLMREAAERFQKQGIRDSERADQAERERDEALGRAACHLEASIRMKDAAERERDEAVTAAMAAARLAELDTLALFSDYECEHGLTIAMEHADEDGPVPCWAHDDMRTLHEWLSSRAALAAVTPPQEGEA